PFVILLGPPLNLALLGGVAGLIRERSSHHDAAGRQSVGPAFKYALLLAALLVFASLRIAPWAARAFPSSPELSRTAAVFALLLQFGRRRECPGGPRGIPVVARIVADGRRLRPAASRRCVDQLRQPPACRAHPPARRRHYCPSRLCPRLRWYCGARMPDCAAPARRLAGRRGL